MSTKHSPQNPPNPFSLNIIEDDEDANTVKGLKQSIAKHLQYTLVKDQYTATKRDCYQAIAYSIRDRLIKQWIATQQRYHKENVKRVYYISMEFLIGRTLGNSLINLNLIEPYRQALDELGLSLEEIREIEWDAGLGNGGLGRLAACFLDSLATLGIPSFGYGIRYEYGIFFQKLQDGYQVETPDNWLRYGNPWEVSHPEYLYPVQFYGRVDTSIDSQSKITSHWVNTEEVMALAYDTPIPGYQNNVVNTMRLWSAKSSRGFDLKYFNHGDYIKAVEEKNHTENISRVLYPSDNLAEGKELRLKQEYFLVSSTIQDILRRYKASHTSFEEFSDKVAIQLNDTHPALAIPELMRIFIDIEDIPWKKAWEITQNTFSYTNHTILPEALECWPETLLHKVLPRHVEIIFEINRRFLNEVHLQYPNDHEKTQQMSIVEEGYQKGIRMANLSIIGSHKVNGVSKLHSDLIKKGLFKDFNEHFPGKFTNMTNGITPRRWLLKANPELAELISSEIGDQWITDLSQLRNLLPLAKDGDFQEKWMQIKRKKKQDLANYLAVEQDAHLNVQSMFDCQVKRIHEYKRQILHVLYAVTQYNRLRENPYRYSIPRTILIGGKAAPGYFMAKLTIKLINAVANVINHDPSTREQLQVVFLNNYNVSLAEKVIPATDLSVQISTAGTEASGTGNMKFALNGALTIGTLDGANIEIKEEVGDENIFIFGHKTEELEEMRNNGYNPWAYYDQNEELQQCMNMLRDGYFSPENPDLFKPIIESLLYGGDRYFLLADYASYLSAQEKVEETYNKPALWTEKSIINVANMGKFSSDRTIQGYASEIWNVPI
jgi:starch phosphorylase